MYGTPVPAGKQANNGTGPTAVLCAKRARYVRDNSESPTHGLLADN